VSPLAGDFDGIGKEIVNDLFEFLLIKRDGVQIGRDLRLEGDVFLLCDGLGYGTGLADGFGVVLLIGLCNSRAEA
jgi:hypothetical protein